MSGLDEYRLMVIGDRSLTGLELSSVIPTKRMSLASLTGNLLRHHMNIFDGWGPATVKVPVSDFKLGVEAVIVVEPWFPVVASVVLAVVLPSCITTEPKAKLAMLGADENKAIFRLVLAGVGFPKPSTRVTRRSA